MSAPTLVLAGTQAPAVSGAAGAAVTPSWGTGQNRTAGHLLTCQVSGVGHSTVPATPAGWKVAAQDGTGSPLYCSSTIFYRIATGADAAPTIAGLAAVTWSATLNEFAGIVGGQDPLDQATVAVNLGSVGYITSSAADQQANGELVLLASTVVYSAAKAGALTTSIHNGATDMSQNNSTAVVTGHYSFDYGFTNTNAAPDQAYLSATNGPAGICSVMASFTPVAEYRPPFVFFGGATDSGTNPWTTRVDGLMTLDPNSASLVNTLVGFTQKYPVGTAQAIPIYIVPPSQPLVPVTVTFDVSYSVNPAPIPLGAQPSGGQDNYLCVVQQQPSGTWTLWELWEAAYSATTGWSCRVGIKRQHITTDNPGYSRNVRTSAGKILEQPIWAVAASRFSLCGGVTQVAEVQAGAINHALALIVHDARQAQWSFPAQWTDGQDTGALSIPYGAHFRLDPTLNIPALGLAPVIQMAAIAVQKYGCIAMDRTLNGCGFAMETAASQFAAQGYDVWDVAPYNTGNWATFPWAHLQLLPMDLRTTQDQTLYVETEA